MNEQYIPHKLGDRVIKSGGDGNPLTATMLGLTLRQALEELRGGPTHRRSGVTTNKGNRRNKARSRMARASRRANRE